MVLQQRPRAQAGFSLVELMVGIAIFVVLAAAGYAFYAGLRPAALRAASDGLRGAIDQARALASGGGNGATIAVLPRAGGGFGFTLRVYRGRPSGADSVTDANVAPHDYQTSIGVVGLATNLTGSSAPPFAIFVNPAGDVEGQGNYAPQFDASGIAHFARIAHEPPCPASGLTITLTANNGARDTLALPCTVIAFSDPPPLVTPTPNAPLLTPRTLVAYWPGDEHLHVVATEFGYTHWFAAASFSACTDANGTVLAQFANEARAVPGAPSAQQFMPPYSQSPLAGEDASPPPAPLEAPFAYPNSAQSSNDAPAWFWLLPQQAGNCMFTVHDAFGQSTPPTALEVMGPLTVTDPLLGQSAQAASATSSLLVNIPFGGALGAAATPPPPYTLAIGKAFDAQQLHMLTRSACDSWASWRLGPSVASGDVTTTATQTFDVLASVPMAQSTVQPPSPCTIELFDMPAAARDRSSDDLVPINATPAPGGEPAVDVQVVTTHLLAFPATLSLSAGGTTANVSVGQYFLASDPRAREIAYTPGDMPDCASGGYVSVNAAAPAASIPATPGTTPAVDVFTITPKRSTSGIGGGACALAFANVAGAIAVPIHVAGQLSVIPAAITIAQGGGDVAFAPRERTLTALLNTLVGGAIADAATSCPAIAYAGPGFSNPIQPGTPAGNALGIVNDAGCYGAINVAGSPVVAQASEPGFVGAYQYEPGSCESMLRQDGWSGNASGSSGNAAVGLSISPAATAGQTCSFTISDNSSSSPAQAVGVNVVGSCAYDALGFCAIVTRQTGTAGGHPRPGPGCPPGETGGPLMYFAFSSTEDVFHNGVKVGTFTFSRPEWDGCSSFSNPAPTGTWSPDDPAVRFNDPDLASDAIPLP